VQRRRDRFRPMASCVAALASVVANSQQVLPTFPPPPLIIPYGGFAPVRLEASLAAPCPSAAVPGGVRRGACVPLRLGLRVPRYRFAAVPRGPWLSAVYHVHACKRSYGLMRRSAELRPAWTCSACSGRSLPWRAIRLTFPSLLGHPVHTCRDLYPVAYVLSVKVAAGVGVGGFSLRHSL